MALPTALAVQAIKNKPKVKVNSKVTTVVLSTALGLGVFFAGRAIWRSFKRNIREGQILKEGNPASFATQLNMAFENDNAFGWGTDEEAVYRTLEQIPNTSMMRRVQRAYKDLFGKNLASDLKNELSTQEFAIAQEIIHAKR
ncbi:hypothetical protein U6A24_18375 [Aquimarina gracilis]|uniref:Annexin n=1 Tax=Aquimarina gracilis TaxID=874422 RepID=A0ABU6A052_9FLAO|nr:hypothetical protein [Aquimarina gracilis]MEB3347448.1 hypothetical protein [Aquimarina gracilis]